MVCIHCGSTNVNVQVVNQQIIKNHHHSFLWWLLIGWWWLPVKWLFLTPIAFFMFILKVCGVRKKVVTNQTLSVCVCQNCGKTF